MNGITVTLLIISLVMGINLWDRYAKRHPPAFSSAGTRTVTAGGLATKDEARGIKAINRVMDAKRRDIQFCYKKELRNKPGLSGEIRLKFTIEYDGSVSKVKVVSSGIKSASLNACLVNVINSLQFEPIDASHGSMTVTYPFVFSSG